ncbi:MAG: UvrD-helicase domain-containing protein [Alphaproteobacteria bacterium]|nr:UvrD-helicase domain-containing protein [Alphaproteobacteria bacterium]
MTSDAFEFGDDLAAGPAEAAPARWPHLAGLNEPQRAAVEATEGPVLVLAGAGTGKTRVLTARLAHILLSRRAWPGQILAVTFTNKAAREMRERVEGLIGGAAEGLWLGTFHALAARILRRHAELVGLKPNFTILDQDDQIRLVKQVMQAAEIDDKRWPARVLHSIIERWKDRGLTPDKVNAGDAGDFAMGRTVELYTEYQARLRTLNAADFGDLLLHNLTLFTGHADVLADYRRRFKYLLVDEYQDTNVAQYLWLRLLAQEHKNICCVGDDDQSIYSWRGAEIGNILKFEKDFPGARVIRLEQNYRSTGEILAAASGLIAHNEGRLGKTLWTADKGGDKIAVRGLWDGEEEARFVCDEIEAIQRKGGALRHMAILVRAGFQTREFEERLLTLGVPYRVIGGPRFYERLEIRDAIAYLRVIAQPDDSLAFERIVNKPRRGIGDATLQTLHRLARAQDISLPESARRIVDSDELRPQARKALGALLADFDRWRGQAESLPQADLAELVLDESGYTGMWQMDKSADAPGRLENLKELVVAMEEFENLAGFLEHVSLVMEATEDKGGDMVNLMTLHSAKGLEFETVFLPGWEEGLFPHQRALDEGGNAALEEERRLAYVGLTRARLRAIVSFAANRRIHNQWQSAIPSRFVDELPKDNVEVTTAPGLYGGAPSGGLDEAADPWAEPEAVYVRNSRAAAMRRGYARGAPPRMIDLPAEKVTLAEAGDSDFEVGARVFHDKFGYGRVVRVEGHKLEIDFEHTGLKKVIDDFVKRA